MKFYLEYFGCRSNQAELQEIALELEKKGYQLTTSLEEASFAILNTCCVTANAEKDVYHYLKKNYRHSKTFWFITGCLVNKEPALKDQFPDCLFLPNESKPMLVNIICEHFPLQSNIIYHSGYKSRFFLKIQNGCNFRCTFCIVPFLRGNSESLPLPLIIKKARQISALGYQEVILTGINLSSYGYDLFPRQNLLDVVNEISSIRNIRLIRLSSLDPRFISYRFINALAKNTKIARHIHLSLQSGSEAVLRRMARFQKRSDMEKIINSFHNHFPDANIGADIIVGFPQETEDEFEETVDLIQKAALNYLHIFPYSARPQTKAFALKTIRPEIIRRRMQTLLEINREIKLRYRRKFLEKELPAILIDDRQDQATAITDNYLNITLKKARGLKKKFLTVRITRIINENLCEGEIVR